MPVGPSTRRATAPALLAGLFLAACGEPAPTEVLQEGEGGVGISAAVTTLTGDQVLIDFESLPLATGASVEGFGTLHPLFDLRSTADPAGDSDGDGETRAVLVEEGKFPSAYFAGGIVNGCLGDPGGQTNRASGAHGFSDAEATVPSPQVPHSYLFRFREGTTVSEFSMLMLDHGDFLQRGRFPISVTLTAFDRAGEPVDEDVATVESRTPRGDACRISEGDPGVRTLAVSGGGIARLTLQQSSDGWDAGLGFDDIRFTVEAVIPVEIDIRPESDENPVSLGGTTNGRGPSVGALPVAVLTTSTDDGDEVDFDATTADPATITLGDDDGDDTPVAERRNGTLMASVEDVDDDGDEDLVLHFEVAALVDNGDLTRATEELILNGETKSAVPIRGSDAVMVVGR